MMSSYSVEGGQPILFKTLHHRCREVVLGSWLAASGPPSIVVSRAMMTKGNAPVCLHREREQGHMTGGTPSPR